MLLDHVVNDTTGNSISNTKDQHCHFMMTTYAVRDIINRWRFQQTGRLYASPIFKISLQHNLE